MCSIINPCFRDLPPPGLSFLGEIIKPMPTQPSAVCPEIATWLFPGVVAAYQMPIATASLDILNDEERPLFSRAVPKRQLEFAAGRACAAVSLNALGLNGNFVSIGENRMPVWPDGVVGSISHDSKLACAVVGRSDIWLGLGIDMETPRRLAPSSAAVVCRDDERDQLGLWPTGVDGLGLVFSAKESVFKCYYPLEHMFLDFQDVALDWARDAADRGRFAVRFIDESRSWRSALRITGRWLSTADRLYTSAFVPA